MEAPLGATALFAGLTRLPEGCPLNIVVWLVTDLSPVSFFFVCVCYQFDCFFICVLMPRLDRLPLSPRLASCALLNYIFGRLRYDSSRSLPLNFAHANASYNLHPRQLFLLFHLLTSRFLMRITRRRVSSCLRIAPLPYCERITKAFVADGSVSCPAYHPIAVSCVSVSNLAVAVEDKSTASVLYPQPTRAHLRIRTFTSTKKAAICGIFKTIKCPATETRSSSRPVAWGRVMLCLWK